MDSRVEKDFNGLVAVANNNRTGEASLWIWDKAPKGQPRLRHETSTRTSFESHFGQQDDDTSLAGTNRKQYLIVTVMRTNSRRFGRRDIR